MTGRRITGLLSFVLVACGPSAARTETIPARETATSAPSAENECEGRDLHRGFVAAPGPDGSRLGELHVHSEAAAGEPFGVCPGDPLRTGWPVQIDVTAARDLRVTAVYVDAGHHARILGRDLEVVAGQSRSIALPGPLSAPADAAASPDGSYGTETLLVVASTRTVGESNAALASQLDAIARGEHVPLDASTHGTPVVGPSAGNVALVADGDGNAVAPFWWGLVVGGTMGGSQPDVDESTTINVIGMVEAH